MRLPDPMERVLDRRWWDPPRPRPNQWRVLWPAPGPGSPIASLNYDRELPPWNSGPYKNDVPVHGR